jgi:hypothetical protein
VSCKQQRHFKDSEEVEKSLGKRKGSYGKYFGENS